MYVYVYTTHSFKDLYWWYIRNLYSNSTGTIIGFYAPNRHIPRRNKHKYTLRRYIVNLSSYKYKPGILLSLAHMPLSTSTDWIGNTGTARHSSGHGGCSWAAVIGVGRGWGTEAEPAGYTYCIRNKERKCAWGIDCRFGLGYVVYVIYMSLPWGSSRVTPGGDMDPGNTHWIAIGVAG